MSQCFSESLGNSKQIKYTFEILEKVFPSKSFETFGLPGSRVRIMTNSHDPYSAAGYLNTGYLFLCLLNLFIYLFIGYYLFII